MIISMILGYANHFKVTDGDRLVNGENVLKIPSIYRLLKSLNVTRQVISSGTAVTFKQNNKNAKNGLQRHPMLNAVFSNRKKSLREMLHRILNARVHHRQDSQLSTKFKSRDSDEKKGSFRISDETVSGKGEYAVSSDQTNVGIKMKIRINTQQKQQQLQQQQKPKPTMVSTPRFTPPQMCLVPCNTKLKPPTAKCIRK